MKPSLDELFGKTTQTSQSKPSLNDIFSGSVTTTPSKPIESEPTFLSNLKSSFIEGLSKIKSGFQTTQKGAMNKDLTQGATEQARGALGIASGAVSTAFSPLTATVQTGLQKTGLDKSVSNVVTSISDKIASSPTLQKFAMENPNAEEVISDLINVIGSAYSPQTAKGISTNITRPILETTAETAGNILANTGKISKTGAGKLYQSAITPNVKEAEKILQAEIKGTVAPQTRASTALEQGIAGTQKGIAVKGGKIADKLYTEKIIPALESTKGKVTMSKSELFARVEDRINKTVDPTKKKSLIDAYEAIRQDYADFPDNFDLVTAQNLKKNLDEFTPEKIFRGQNVANELKVLNNDMANAIRSKTYGALEDVNIKKDYLDYGNLKELEKIGVKAITESGRFGGTGTLLSYLSDKALTPVKTIGGQVLYRIGDAFEVTGKKGLKTFADYLKANKINLKAK